MNKPQIEAEIIAAVSNGDILPEEAQDFAAFLASRESVDPDTPVSLVVNDLSAGVHFGLPTVELPGGGKALTAHIFTPLVTR